MEIINYIQSTPKSKKSIRINFSSKNSYREPVRQKKSVSYSMIYPSERKSFFAGVVSPSVNPRTVFAAIGRGVSDFFEFLIKNIKSVLIIAGVLGVFSASVYGINKIITYRQDFTGPVEINYSDSLDITNLNALMASFAKENSTDFDANGNLLDASVCVQSVTQPVTFQTYKVRSGDTISGIAKKFGLSNISTLISINDISNVRQLCAGQKLRIPSIDGIVYTVKKGDSINSIVEKNGIRLETLLDVNELNSENLTVGQQLFLPGVGLDSNTLRNAMGELFKLPIKASFRWSSPYGWRTDPIKGVRSFHTGTDMAAPAGTPILASNSGKVSFTGVSNVFGNYVIINHDNGYQTLYAHMSKIIAKKGQWVSQGTIIGLVGSTGYSTGNHLHFTVYKNGKLVDPMSVLK